MLVYPSIHQHSDSILQFDFLYNSKYLMKIGNMLSQQNKEGEMRKH